MLMTVLRGPVAVQQSRTLIRLFKAMKDYIIENRDILKQQEQTEIAMRVSNNAEMITKLYDDKKNMQLELKKLSDKIDDTVKKSEIIIIDNYIGIKTLRLLQKVRDGVGVVIYSDNLGNYLHKRDLADFKKEFPKIRVNFRKTCGITHDRYILLDSGTKWERVFHAGASSKDAGEKMTAITEYDDEGIVKRVVEEMMGRLGKNPEPELVA